MSGQSKGDKDCIHCLDDTKTLWLNNSQKQVYVWHRRFLPASHGYRGMKCQIDGTREEGKAPRHFSGSTSTNRSRISPLHMGRKALPSEERESGINKMIQRRQSGILN